MAEAEAEAVEEEEEEKRVKRFTEHVQVIC